uniref:C2H2-type domain-containing protein n=1 Tax=Anopheles epiroticus TaxID=199890 RepID=A0A182PKW1_9DIPT
MSTLDANLEPQITLYDSKVCRLCGEKNENGRPMFRDCDANGVCEVSKLINQYLPVKVHDDGILPRWICPGCHIQLESTAQFFEMILKGQQTIESMRAKQQPVAVHSSVTRADDVAQLCDIMDPEKWNELFEKPGMMINTDKEGLLVPLELFELEDLFKPIDNPPKPGPSMSAVEPPNEPQESAKGASSPPDDETGGEKDRNEAKDWIVKSEVTASTGRGRVIGFVHHNHSKTDIGNLVLVEDVSGKKKISAKFVCDICSESFAREPRYLKHRKTHTILFECSVCLLKFGSNGKLLIHQQQTLHIGKGMVEGLQLPDDGGGSSKHKEGNQSEPPKSGDVYACDSCDNTFAGLNTVLKHEESAHAHENHSFVCIECGKAFREKNLLHRHRQTHVQDRLHRCTVCEAAFKTRSTLTKHA